MYKYHYPYTGYSTNQDFDYDALAPLLQFHLNNAGDPFLGSSFSLNSTAFEVSVLDWFAKVWEIEKGEYWGCVITDGTEAWVWCFSKSTHTRYILGMGTHEYVPKKNFQKKKKGTA